jgi:hypothetical protein
LGILSKDELSSGWLKNGGVFMPYDKKRYFPEAVRDRSLDFIMKAYHRTWVTLAVVKNKFEEYELYGDW